VSTPVTTQNGAERRWEKVKLRIAHPSLLGGSATPEQINEALEAVHEACEATPTFWTLQQYRAAGCDATRFYVVRDDDWPIERILCEHEIAD